MLNDLSQIFLTFLYKNMTVSVVIIAVLLARFLLRKMPKKYSYILWSIVGIRMIFDLPFATNISVFNLFRGFAKHTSTVEAMLAGSHRTNLQGSTNLLNKTDTTGAAAAHASRSTAVEAMTHTLTTSQTVLGILGLLWLIVVALFVAYGIYSYVKCRLLVRTAVIARDITPDSHKKKNNVSVWECDRIPSPFVLGIIRSRIYIPFRMPKQEQAYILAHEECHIRRLDPLWKLIAFLLLAVYWWNPLVWIAFFYMVRDMEMSCDEAVIEQFGNEIKQGYSNSLLSFAMERHPYSFAPVAFGEGDAGRRIKNVLNFKKPHTWVAAIATVLVALVAVSCLTNQKPSETKTEHTTEKVDSTQQPVQENAGAAIIEQNIREWAQAFCDRDTEKIVQMTSKEVQSNLEKIHILWMDGDTPSFGWSSPWPWGAFGSFFGGTGEEMDGYWLHEINTEEQTAEILYYVESSDPHVSVWIENIHYAQENGQFQITQEKINQFADGPDAKTDGIASADEFDTAYAQGISDTQMDYCINGMGEVLNKNMVPIGALLEPTDAARQLLNLSSDKKLVSVEKESESADKTQVGIQITFLKDGQKRYLSMIQPWGKEGIWVPAEAKEGK